MSTPPREHKNVPSGLSLNIKDKATLRAIYMPFLLRGGIFVPTADPYTLGDEVFLTLAIMNDKNKYSIATQVAWITPKGAVRRQAQGIGLHFAAAENTELLRNRIEDLLKGVLSSEKATYTL